MRLPAEMDVDSRFFEFVEQEEGREKFSYPDSNGKATIGIGHLLTASELSSGKILINGVPVKYREGLTDKQIDDLLLQDMSKARRYVRTFVKAPLTQNQFNALVSFTFNVGTNAFSSSTLLKNLNAEMYSSIPTQMRRWKYDDGKVVQGLINRREHEIELWFE
jgi:lysozyme